jgi:hypothetical protein
MGIKKSDNKATPCAHNRTRSPRGGNPPLDPPKKTRRHRRGAFRADHERRDQSFKIRLTGGEHALLEVRAMAAGVSPSQYLREQARLSKGHGNPAGLAAAAVVAQASQWLSRIADAISGGRPGWDAVLCLAELRKIRSLLKQLLPPAGGKSC